MKNREKYREAIKDILMYDSPSGVCRFLSEEVIPCYTEDHTYRGCSSIDCDSCRFMFMLWLDEECVEPLKPKLKSEVDWSKVPVDTLVRVRDYEDEPWKFMYFHGYNPQNYHKFEDAVYREVMRVQINCPYAYAGALGFCDKDYEEYRKKAAETCIKCKEDWLSQELDYELEGIENVL